MEIGEHGVGEFWKPPLEICERDRMSKKAMRCEVGKILINALQNFEYLSAGRWWGLGGKRNGMRMQTAANNKDPRARMTIFLQRFKTPKCALTRKVGHLCQKKFAILSVMLTW